MRTRLRGSRYSLHNQFEIVSQKSTKQSIKHLTEVAQRRRTPAVLVAMPTALGARNRPLRSHLLQPQHMPYVKI